MSAWTSAVIIASEGAAEHNQNPWLFGLAALGVLLGLLILTLIINVDR